MYLSRIRIRNYRLLVDAELEVDAKTTLIVGRNNTAKTSLLGCIYNILNEKKVSLDDYPLQKRGAIYTKVALFVEKKLSFEDLCKEIETISVEFEVDYSLNGLDDSLGALSPFIIDVDEDTSTALIRAEYRLKGDEESLRTLLVGSYDKGGALLPSKDIRDTIADKFSTLFGLTVYAINPKNAEDKQVKSLKELKELFPIHFVRAERVLGEDDAHSSSLGAIISDFFDMREGYSDARIEEQRKSLRDTIEEATRTVQEQSDKILSEIVSSSTGFGYPKLDELSLGVTTQLSIDDQIKKNTQLSYTSGKSSESLPSSYNGLGYKNLIKIEFELAAFAKTVASNGAACIPLLFIEEPESHMHPQMQTAFAEYLEGFLAKQGTTEIQSFLTTHSAHIANTIEFAKIRYAQKSSAGVIYKNLNTFAREHTGNVDFIRKYLTLTKCDLFFADKAILIEGASERLLLPDMIDKCERDGSFGSCKYPLSVQYYTLVEIGGAYAHKFIPFMEFLNIPCLVLTDIDSIRGGKTVMVSCGETTSNATIKWWVRNNKGISADDKSKIGLSEICSMKSEDKTRGNCHIEFQTAENGFCGRSLEEAIRNVNRAYYELDDDATEEELRFSGTSKTEFALRLIYEHPNYVIPGYIKSGLIWLNGQNVLR